MVEKKDRLSLRARVIISIRRFFEESGYLEVDTPIIIPAPAPEVHIDAIRAGYDRFLQTSPELCMKRLMASGYPKIFQICKCFRESERGHNHLPEFTILEWYRSGIDYQDLMMECEEMIHMVVRDLGIGQTIAYLGDRIDLSRPWDRLSVEEAFNCYSSTSLNQALEEDRFDEIMVLEIEPRLNRKRPLFLYDYPASLASLARIKEKKPDVSERFELYLGGLELANAFSELTDAGEQARRFDLDQERRKRMGKSSYPIPEKFLKALDTMPPTAGIAFGLDRLVMILGNTDRIDDVVAFTPEEL
ncbi:MAG: EF-P lysine aminoacylase GenX [Deltaproteobacteria bacterium]|nr:EF-P lysine aminoacylase GenX [Deltaproteobacteria bacterium]